MGFLVALAVAALLTGAAAGAAAAAQPDDLADLAWLEGAWRADAFGGVAEEIWLPARGDAMHAVFRHVKDGRVTFTEYIQVLAADGRLTMTFNHFRPDYSTWEGAGPPMTLTLAESSAGHARFVRANDVSPDEIVYTLVGEELHVTVTGVDEPLVFRR